MTTLAEIAATGELDGFRPTSPATARHAADRLDREACDYLTCEECGRDGWLQYRPFHKAGLGEYGERVIECMAYAVCPDCQHAHLIDPGVDYTLAGV